MNNTNGDQESHVSDSSDYPPWLQNATSQPDLLGQEQLCEWIRTGAASASRGPLGNHQHHDGPYDFCAPPIIDRLAAAHERQANFSERDKANAGARHYPFELVGSHIFSSETAMKCANLDALLKFTSTPPPMDADETMFTYADITTAADDFGAVEYIQWRLGRRATGYAFDTGCADQLRWCHALPDKRPVSPLVLHRVAGGGGGGCIVPSNIRAFIAFVHAEQPDGVHLAYSEHIGGSREAAVKQQVLGNAALCLAVLRPSGTMVVKLMETHTHFTVGLIFLLRQCFGQLSIVKPATARTFSADRYLVLRSRLTGVRTIVEHLLCTNECLVRMAASGGDIVELVPLDTMRADSEFCAYMMRCNEQLAELQTNALEECRRLMMTVMQPRGSHADVELKSRLRAECLRQWDMPDCNHIARPDVYWQQLALGVDLFSGFDPDMAQFTELVDGFSQSTCLLDDWYFAPVCAHSGTGPAFFVSMGAGRTLMFDQSGRWTDAGLLNVTLPEGTLLYGEIVDEFTCAGNFPHVYGSNTNCLHVFDLLCLHFESYAQLNFADRRHRLTNLVERLDNQTVRKRPFFPITELLSYVSRARMGWKLNQDTGRKHVMFKATTDTFYVAGGIYFYRAEMNTQLFEMPMFWSWSGKPKEILNALIDAPGHFHWFENRLAALRSKRAV